MTVFVTASADGKIASPTGESRLSCPFDKRRQHMLRALHDAVMVGARTVARDDPLLTVRLVNQPSPTRIVVDGKLSSPLQARVFNTPEVPTIVITSAEAPHHKVKALMEKGVKIIIAASEGTDIIMSDALSKLWTVGIRSILVEGGGNLIWRLFKEGLVDEYRVTVSPFIIGGSKSITPVEGEGFKKVEDWVKLELLGHDVCDCGKEIHLIYRVLRNRLLGDPISK